MSSPKIDQIEVQDAFAKELSMLVSRFIDNWELSVASALGVLDMVKLDLFINATREEEDEE